jgi:hypothetical protein
VDREGKNKRGKERKQESGEEFEDQNHLFARGLCPLLRALSIIRLRSYDLSIAAYVVSEETAKSMLRKPLKNERRNKGMMRRSPKKSKPTIDPPFSPRRHCLLVLFSQSLDRKSHRTHRSSPVTLNRSKGGPR